FVSHEVIASKEAILAEDVARDRYLRRRESPEAGSGDRGTGAARSGDRAATGGAATGEAEDHVTMSGSSGATSLICAPVMWGDKVLGLIHLYCTDPRKSLSNEDLEFTVAVA